MYDSWYMVIVLTYVLGLGMHALLFHFYFHITLLNTRRSFSGSLEYNSGMLENLCKETQIHTVLLASYCYIPRAHIVEKCYAIMEPLNNILEMFDKKNIFL